jgi:hypothetical protein
MPWGQYNPEASSTQQCFKLYKSHKSLGMFNLTLSNFWLVGFPAHFIVPNVSTSTEPTLFLMANWEMIDSLHAQPQVAFSSWYGLLQVCHAAKLTLLLAAITKGDQSNRSAICRVWSALLGCTDQIEQLWTGVGAVHKRHRSRSLIRSKKYVNLKVLRRRSDIAWGLAHWSSYGCFCFHCPS